MITCIIPSDLDVVSVSEVKAHLRLDHDHENDYLKTLIRTMTNLVEEYTNKSLLHQTWQLVHNVHKVNNSHEQVIELPRGPIQEIISIQHIKLGNKKEKLKRHSVRVEGPIVSILCSADYQTVEVTYRSGYGDMPHHVPASLRQAIILGVGEMYEKRQNAFHSPDTLVHALMRPYCHARLN